jgi:hypothetical protein
MVLISQMTDVDPVGTRHALKCDLKIRRVNPLPGSKEEHVLVPSGAKHTFRNLCTTLVAMDDCCNTVWTSPRNGIAIPERIESFD